MLPLILSIIHLRGILSSYNIRNGWYTNWASLVDNAEIYALVVKGTVDIQGLVAIQRDSCAKAVYIQWMSSAPWNNKERTETPRYEGVGGHLFAISGRVSSEAGFDGYVFGFASNQKVLEHYIEKLGAIHIGLIHPYQFAIEADAMKKILETYTFEQTDEEV